MGIEKTISSGDRSFRKNLEKFDDNLPALFLIIYSLFLKTLKTAEFCRKVSQITNLIIFKREILIFTVVKIKREEQLPYKYFP